MTGILLAGGASLRMGGKDKALLLWGGETLLERKIRLLSPLCGAILAVAAPGVKYKNAGVPVVCDESFGIGPLMGLYKGLKQSGEDLNFVTTVDSPFFCRELALYLAKKTDGFDAYVPRWNGYVEPLFGVYRKTCLPAIEKALAGNTRSIHSLYPYIDIGFAEEEVVRRLDPQGLSFININTEEDYRKSLAKYGMLNPFPTDADL